MTPMEKLQAGLCTLAEAIYMACEGVGVRDLNNLDSLQKHYSEILALTEWQWKHEHESSEGR